MLEQRIITGWKQGVDEGRAILFYFIGEVFDGAQFSWEPGKHL